MLKVIFYLKTEQADKNGEFSIFARITYNTKRITLSTGKAISKERWAYTNNLRNVLKLEKEKVLKNYLDLYRLNVEKKFNKLFNLDSEVSLDLLKAELSGKAEIKTKQITIIEIMQKHNKHFKKMVLAGERSSASFQKYERASNLLSVFIKKHYGNDDMVIEDISSAFVFSLEEYLKYESSYKGQIGIKNNSVVKYMKMYKTACNYCFRMDLIQKNPFNIYNGKLNVTDAIFLSQQELNKITDKPIFIERLQKVRDIFLFCCYTGYAPVDAISLTKANLSEDNNGNLWIMANRTKTTIRENVPVLPPALAIINKYKNKQTFLLPQISNQKMNAYLKEIADICDIDKHLTWYVSRHTFGTTVTLGNGVRLEHVSSMMGHTNIKQTQHYAKVLDVNVMDDMNKLKDKFQ
ncbi:phage integrase SAM-like domain-containing protein [Flavobacterium aquidurense]|uniref:site-specific integrase n=1 Tax=Flavobacterium aquidurense TaxID=362413 RepID=UPI0028644E51|nr:phage integrase SAM-like domain-containing protein [Flavobacterium aquidurense]MDR7371035.1 site-specific recombinase XerD [Flavobacterium aquidurense]